MESKRAQSSNIEENNGASSDFISKRFVHISNCSIFPKNIELDNFGLPVVCLSYTNQECVIGTLICTLGYEPREKNRQQIKGWPGWLGAAAGEGGLRHMRAAQCAERWGHGLAWAARDCSANYATPAQTWVI